MPHGKVRVLVNGYGVIGKRIADAVVAQPDMELVGIADVVSDWRVKVAVEKGYSIFASTPQALEAMRAAGIQPISLIDDALNDVDIVADATPKDEVFYNYQVYNQAIVVPETIDAIRALMETELDGTQSTIKTDHALGMMREFTPRHDFSEFTEKR